MPNWMPTRRMPGRTLSTSLTEILRPDLDGGSMPRIGGERRYGAAPLTDSDVEPSSTLVT